MAHVSFIYDSCIQGYHAYGMRQWEKFCTAIAKQIILTMTKQLQLFIVELPLATCQGMCHKVFIISPARREHYCYCCLNQKVFKGPSTGRIRNSMSVHTRGLNNVVRKIRIFLASCESNYKVVKSSSEVSLSNDSVIKTEPNNG